jgi:aminopeptidase N
MSCCERGFEGVDALESLRTAQLLRAPKEFAGPDTPEQFPPDVPVDWQELTLVVDVDVQGRRVTGTATYEGVVRRGEVRRLRFDADQIGVLRAFGGNGRALAFDHDGRELHVDLATPARRGESLRVAVDFATAEPRAGFYFVLPDADHPDRVAHAWTQGQDEDSRFWFPCHDSPNHKMRLHVVATVPEGMIALSNGALRDIYRAADTGKRIFDWQLARPVPTYLLTIVVGPFVEVRQQDDPLPVSFWVLPGRELDGERAFARTPAMIRHFEGLFGVRYPYEKYGQVAVQEFVFGGMENASMTTQTDLTLHDERAHLDFSSDPLVSHELAHQWFGDLVTCRTWAHGWLNEGFATYFEQLWHEHTHPSDEFDHHRLLSRRAYLNEDSGRYRRPIVTNRWHEPIDVFDAHLYDKAGAVLHMLRRVLGDAAFFGGVGAYLNAHSDGNVETPDLRRALERFSGVDLGRFFSQWLENGKGHPELKVSGAWDGDDRQWKLTLEQKQDTQHAPLFALQVPVELHVDGQLPIRRTVTLDRKLQSYWFDLPQAPQMVLVDGRGDLLATAEWELGDAMLRTLIERAPTSFARIQAAAALGKRPSAQNLDALAWALAQDKVWCTQAEIARVLAKVGSQRAYDILAANVDLAHPKARRAVRSALGQFQTAAAGQLLAARLAAGDASYFVEAETATALGRTRAGEAFSALQQALERDSWNETVRVGVLDGLAVLQNPAAIDIVKPLLAAHRPTVLRCAAVRCLCSFATEPAKVVDALRSWTADGNFKFALTLAQSLGGLGDARAVPLLDAVAERAIDGRVKRRARESISQVRAGLGAGKQVDALRADLDALCNQHRELLDRFDRTERLRADQP